MKKMRTGMVIMSNTERLLSNSENENILVNNQVFNYQDDALYSDGRGEEHDFNGSTASASGANAFADAVVCSKWMGHSC